MPRRRGPSEGLRERLPEEGGRAGSEQAGGRWRGRQGQSRAWRAEGPRAGERGPRDAQVG